MFVRHFGSSCACYACRKFFMNMLFMLGFLHVLSTSLYHMSLQVFFAFDGCVHLAQQLHNILLRRNLAPVGRGVEHLMEAVLCSQGVCSQTRRTPLP